MCSNCGNIKEKLSLTERIYQCEKCNFKIDRDLNAAIKLEQYDAESYAVNACGESNKQSSAATADSVKQEANRNLVL